MFDVLLRTVQACNVLLKKQSVSEKTMEYCGFALIHVEVIIPLSNHNTTE